MKIFLKVREEYEQALMRDEEVVAGIPAYVPFLLSSSFSLPLLPSSSSSSSSSSSRIVDRNLYPGLGLMR
jgi:hypothetical protein